MNMKFINVNFESSYFKKYLVENFIFKNTIFQGVEFYDCLFKNSRVIYCNLSEVDITETIFNECTFVKNCFGNAVFELSHFLKLIFEDMKGDFIGSAVPIDSKFSNSKKSIEFEGEMYFNDIFDQIDKFYINEE